MMNDEYNKYFNLLLTNKNIVDSNEIISAFSLYNYLNNYFFNLRKIRNGNINIVNQMNSQYTFKDRLHNIKNCNLNPWFRRIFVSAFDDRFIRITIIVNPLYRKKEFTSSNVYYHLIKDRYTKDIYFDDKILNNKIFNMFYQEIIDMFEIAELYANVFMLDKKDWPIYNQIFNMNNIDSIIKYDIFGNVSSYIKSDGKVYNNESIKEIKNIILQKIPIHIDELDTISKHIVKTKINNS